MHRLRAMTTPEDLVGSRDACAALGIDRSTLVRWVRAGKLVPARRISAGGAYLFDRAKVDALAAERKVGAR